MGNQYFLVLEWEHGVRRKLFPLPGGIFKFQSSITQFSHKAILGEKDVAWTNFYITFKDGTIRDKSIYRKLTVQGNARNFKFFEFLFD